jgi:deazaflavin-dependent oxidoreductase (nitroreductase family)
LRFLDLVERSWPLLGRLMGLHTVAYRATGGIIGHRIPGAVSMLLLEHVGGVERAAADLAPALPARRRRPGDRRLQGRHPKNPAWYHNLRANPETTVQVGSEKRQVRARVASAEERKRLWPKMVEIYGPYRDYQRRADRVNREIPLVILEPADAARAGRSAARAR